MISSSADAVTSEDNPQNQPRRIHDFSFSSPAATGWSNGCADHAADSAISERSHLNPVRIFLKRAVGVPVLQRLSDGALLQTSFAHATRSNT